MATNLRIVRITMLNILRPHHITVAGAKGPSARKVTCDHAIHTNSFALVTCLGLQFGGLRAGSWWWSRCSDGPA